MSQALPSELFRGRVKRWMRAGGAAYWPASTQPIVIAAHGIVDAASICMLDNRLALG
jgi:hypothetical protein